MKLTITLVAMFGSATAALAQATESKFEKQTARLRAALENMAGLDSVKFATSLATETKGGGKPAPKRVSGLVHGDTMIVTAQDDELVTRGRTTIARKGGGEWAVRANRLHDGAKAPFVLDPQRLFQALAGLDLEVAHADVGSVDERPVEVLSASLTRDQVAELVWAGVLPDAPGTGAIGRMVLVAGGVGAGGAPQPPSFDVDVAFFVDPATKSVLSFRANMYSDDTIAFGGGAAGAFVVRGARVRVFGGAAGDEQDEEEEAEEPESDSPQWQDGLLERKLKQGESRTHLRARFEEHGQVATPELDAEAKRLLRFAK